MCEKCGTRCPICGHAPGERLQLSPPPPEPDPVVPARPFTCWYCHLTLDSAQAVAGELFPGLLDHLPGVQPLPLRALSLAEAVRRRPPGRPLPLPAGEGTPEGLSRMGQFDGLKGCLETPPALFPNPTSKQGRWPL